MTRVIREMYFIGIAILLTNCGQVFNFDTSECADVDLEADAEAILLAIDRDAEIMQIFPYRNFFERKRIAEIYKQLYPTEPLVPEQYIPLRGDPFQDLIFVLTTDFIDVSAAFIHAALSSTKPETFSTTITSYFIILDVYKEQIITYYNHKSDFKETLNETISKSNIPTELKSFLQELVKRRRKSRAERFLENDEIKKSTRVTQMLLRECRGWDKNRAILDYLLMNERSDFAKWVMVKFVHMNNGENIFTAIDKYITDKYLKFAYETLVKYTMNWSYLLVERIHDGELEPFGEYATNNFIIPMASEIFLQENDISFLRKYNQCMSEYLLFRNNEDRVNQILAAMLDNSCESAKKNVAGFGDVE